MHGSIHKFIMFVCTYINHCTKTKLQYSNAVFHPAWATTPFSTLEWGLLRLPPIRLRKLENDENDDMQEQLVTVLTDVKSELNNTKIN